MSTQALFPIAIELLEEDNTFAEAPIEIALDEVAVAELPITTELQAPVPPLDVSPKTIVPVAPGKILEEFPITKALEDVIAEEEVPITIEPNAALVQDVLPITVEHVDVNKLEEDLPITIVQADSGFKV